MEAQEGKNGENATDDLAPKVLDSREDKRNKSFGGNDHEVQEKSKQREHEEIESCYSAGHEDVTETNHFEVLQEAEEPADATIYLHDQRDHAKDLSLKNIGQVDRDRVVVGRLPWAPTEAWTDHVWHHPIQPEVVDHLETVLASYYDRDRLEKKAEAVEANLDLHF